MHLLVAWITVSILIGRRPANSSTGALADLARSGPGLVLLLVLASGFVVLGVWQAIAGLVGYRHLDGGRRHLMRLGAGCRVVTYGYLAFSIGRLLLDRHAAGSSPRSTSAGVLAQPLGRVVLGGAGLVIIGIGIGLAVFGVRREFLDQLDDEAQNGGRRVPIVVLGEAGYVAKGIAFVVVGIVVAWAGATGDPRKTGGLDQSLERLVGAPVGVVAIAVIGTGIGCFGLYLLARARHLRPRTLTS
jgi:hypothetical protein